MVVPPILEHPYRAIESGQDFLKRTDWIFTPQSNRASGR